MPLPEIPVPLFVKTEDKSIRDNDFFSWSCVRRCIVSGSDFMVLRSANSWGVTKRFAYGDAICDFIARSVFFVKGP